jgi:antitoxin HigA-1
MQPKENSGMARKRKPMHPGEVLREEFLVPLGLSAGALAKACGVPRTRIERIANEEALVPAETAPGLGSAGRSACRSSFG